MILTLSIIIIVIASSKGYICLQIPPGLIIMILNQQTTKHIHKYIYIYIYIYEYRYNYD